MIGALNAAATGMQAQMEEISQISNNLANVNTAGFKRTRAEFQDLMYETLQEPGAQSSTSTQAPVGIQRGMGVRVSGTQRNFEMGAPQSTQRDLDLMIQGDGFLVIQLPTGEFAYKREGSLHRSATGRIETIEGYPVQPEITLPPATKKVEISHDGNVTAFMSETDRVNLGQLQIATFTNRGGLKAHGKNIFMATEASGPANLGIPGQGSVGPILQGYLESSNVEMVKEMTEMISAQRAYEMNAKVMQAVDQVLQQTSSIR